MKLLADQIMHLACLMIQINLLFKSKNLNVLPTTVAVRATYYSLIVRHCIFSLSIMPVFICSVLLVLKGKLVLDLHTKTVLW